MSRRSRSGVEAEISDEALLDAFVRGEDPEGTFRELVERHERRVYAVCYRYFGDRPDAEDATQETFLRVARHAGTFDGASRFTTWLHRIAFNACHDTARRRARRPQTPVEDITVVADSREAHEDLGWDPGDPVVAAQTTRRVRDALLLLDEVSRTLLVLVALEGATYAEAAAALDVPVGTAKSRVHRARARLAELLADDAPGNPGDARGVPPVHPPTNADDLGGRP